MVMPHGHTGSTWSRGCCSIMLQCMGSIHTEILAPSAPHLHDELLRPQQRRGDAVREGRQAARKPRVAVKIAPAV